MCVCIQSSHRAVPFNRYIIEARLALGAIHPEEFPLLAMDALEDGIDGPATRRTAILLKRSGWEVDPLLNPLRAERGLCEISVEIASVRLAQDLAREILREGKDPLQFTRTFERFWINADYPRVIQDLGTMKR